MRDPVSKLIRWVLGDEQTARSRLMRSITGVFVGNSIAKMGDRQGNMRGAPAGGVAWPVDPTTHDGASFIHADAFFAHYDAKEGEVYCLDDIGGKRHTGADPLRVGKNVEIHAGEKRSGRGIVVRSAEYGTAGLYKNIFIHADADLIAHHRQPDPPDNSSMVHDPGEGPDDWAGGLHYPLRVRKWIESFCQGRTTSDDEQLYAPLFNFTRNGDGTVAHGAAHFAQHEATLSHEASGPLRPSAKKHELGHTGDSSVRAGAIDINAYFSDGSNGFTGPIQFSRTQWERGKKYLYVTNPELRMDPPRLHDFNCGPRQGVFDFWDTVPITVYDPPPWEPETPPPRRPKQPPPRDPEDDEPPPERIIRNPDDPRFPIPEIGFPEYPYRYPSHKPSVSAPQEIETPSAYKHPRPGIPDDASQGSKSGDDSYEGQWRDELGFTEAEWMQTPIVAHEDSMPVFESTTANENGDGPAGRWPTTKVEHELVMYDQDGRVLGRHPAIGPGSVIDMPANMNASHTLQENDGRWPDTIPAFSRIVFAAKNAQTGATVDGRFGLGSRIHTSAYPVRGFDISLDFSTDADNPDTNFTARDETGATGTGRFVFNGGSLIVNGLEVGGTEVDPTAQAPAGSMVMYAAASAPSGWLLCDGSAVSRTTYAALFTAIGTNYGAGDGSTTFNVPDMRGRSPVGYGNGGGGLTNRALNDSGGAETHTLTSGEMPTHAHGVTVGDGGSGHTHAAATNAAGVASDQGSTASVSTASAGAAGAHNNMHPYLVVNFIIKT